MRSRLPVWLLLGVVLAACGNERPPPFSAEPDADTGAGGLVGGAGGAETCPRPPPPDAAGFCGNEVVPVLTNKPSVYFVLDGSASMEDNFEGTPNSKLLSAKFAIRDMLLEIGHRIRYGAAVFPAANGAVCDEGAQVFGTVEGDSLLCNGAEYGPVLERFLNSIGFRRAQGGTPTAATLQALSPTLRALTGPTSVVLITDGGPNCNSDAECDAGTCIPNLERQRLDGEVCGEDIDCCDTNLLGPGARRSCVDEEGSTAVIESLADAGIRTFVVGMPGSETYADVLDAMALAGATAREGDGSKYFSVVDTADLTNSLLSIGSEVSLSCEIALRAAPPDPEQLNVYFDNDPVALDTEDGWSYEGGAVIELHGEACEALSSGAVSQLQVVAGCPTIVK